MFDDPEEDIMWIYNQKNMINSFSRLPTSFLMYRWFSYLDSHLVQGIGNSPQPLAMFDWG
jgi:hypothetical protein